MIFRHRPRVSLVLFSFCWWRYNRLLMASQWPGDCDAITWIVKSNSSDIDFIHGDIHGRFCEILIHILYGCFTHTEESNGCANATEWALVKFDLHWPQHNTINHERCAFFSGCTVLDKVYGVYNVIRLTPHNFSFFKGLVFNRYAYARCV